ncbi:alpha/beta fold hydrolase [Yinghuangia seranimata]|uniref:alpha/beta fold hydrolase n=1 Tax=Yinghuangia seranimata TaxID=408067 RepID=UPI00248B7D67|nr:alpha/beta hydrolase [Yinghuangia seranimata]MDI2125959.1 alpha/beta hydrolase [Yinghuangia seranimata]
MTVTSLSAGGSLGVVPAGERVVPGEALEDLAELDAVSRWVRVPGGPVLHVLDYGGALPPVLVVPGITSPAVSFDFVARELVDLVRPIVLDTRGRGLSGSGGSYTLDDYAADTEAVAIALGLDRPLLLGHSMGARVAAAVAVRGVVPVAGCVLVDPPMSGPGRAPYPTTLEVFMAQLAEAREGTDAEAVARSWPRWPHREQALRARWLASCGGDAVAETHAGFEAEDFFALWPQVPAPAALLYGADSLVVTEAGAAEAVRGNPGARYEAVPDAGHMVFWDNPPAGLAATRAALSAMLP